jgi:glycosyltransferase involved in cell wall biosynthesis
MQKVPEDRTANKSSLETADIALLLEGTYPFVRGGVSSWVHQLILDLPELSFHLVFLGARSGDYGSMRYDLPPNVRGLSCFFLFDPLPAPEPRARAGKKSSLVGCPASASGLQSGSVAGQSSGCEAGSLASVESMTKGLKDFLYSRLAWNFIVTSYETRCSELSFVDYFWAVRAIHLPLYWLAQAVSKLPPAHALHAVSTGYAGLLGAFASKSTGTPLVLTEHGIYTKERKIDLYAWHLKDTHGLFENSSLAGLPYKYDLWVRFFQWAGGIAYSCANPVVSLYEKNRARQIEDGARQEQTQVVPNGVDLQRFAPLRELRDPENPPVIGLIGRIVPIKDIKTFIRGIHIMRAHLPNIQGWLIGPDDEDPDYAEECRSMAASLGLGGSVVFLGFKALEEVLPQLGLLALTSISEAFPLVVVEAFASGIPVVATDVGACRELIEGREPWDRKLGHAGAVIPIADPDSFAQEALSLLADEARWRAAQAAALARVERYYTQDMVLARYRSIYQGVMGPSWQQ